MKKKQVVISVILKDYDIEGTEYTKKQISRDKYGEFYQQILGV